MSTNTSTKSLKKGKIDIRMFAMVGALILMWILFASFTDGVFIGTRNLSNLFRQMAIVGILGVGMVLVIVTGGIDLSVSTVVGFIGVVAAMLMAYEQWSTPLTIIVCLVLGIIIGTINGLLIAYASIPAFIVTLGAQLMYRGLLLALGGGVSIAPLNPDYVEIAGSYVDPLIGYIIAACVIGYIAFSIINSANSKKKYNLQADSNGKIVLKIVGFSALVLAVVVVLNDYNGIPSPVLILLVLVAIFTFVAEKTKFGRRIYALGGNSDAARMAGINVKKNIALVYVINGLLATIAGIVLSSRLNAGTPSGGTNMELDAIASAVIGGASMSGGSGKVAGAILGALVMTTIDNGMSLMNLDQSWQYCVKGLILVVAVWFDTRTKTK